MQSSEQLGQRVASSPVKYLEQLGRCGRYSKTDYSLQGNFRSACGRFSNAYFSLQSSWIGVWPVLLGILQSPEQVLGRRAAGFSEQLGRHVVGYLVMSAISRAVGPACGWCSSAVFRTVWWACCQFPGQFQTSLFQTVLPVCGSDPKQFCGHVTCLMEVLTFS